MDRSEAYALLTEEMARLSRLAPDELKALGETSIEVDRQGAGGGSYRVEMTVEQTEGGRFVVLGRIHDNDTYRFSLLEERLEFEPGKAD